MKVFEIKPDFRFQTFYTSDPTVEEFSEFEYSREMIRCEPMLPLWKPLRLFEESAKRKRGNFARSWGSGFIVDEPARNAVERTLKDKCEFLPLLPYKGEVLHVMNILLSVDCLDEDNTIRAIDEESGKKLSIIHTYHFLPNRIPHSVLFKLPRRVALLTASGIGSPELEFKSIVENEGLTGLKFEILWSDG